MTDSHHTTSQKTIEIEELEVEVQNTISCQTNNTKNIEGVDMQMIFWQPQSKANHNTHTHTQQTFPTDTHSLHNITAKWKKCR